MRGRGRERGRGGGHRAAPGGGGRGRKQRGEGGGAPDSSLTFRSSVSISSCAREAGGPPDRRRVSRRLARFGAAAPRPRESHPLISPPEARGRARLLVRVARVVVAEGAHQDHRHQALAGVWGEGRRGLRRAVANHGSDPARCEATRSGADRPAAGRGGEKPRARERARLRRLSREAMKQ